MSTSVDSSSTTQRSRRAMLAGALGGIGAFVATAVARRTPVRGADGGALLLGTSNDATAATGVTRSGLGDAFYVNGVSNSDAVNGYAVDGRGVFGYSSTGTGVYGTGSGTGLWGWAPVALRTNGRLKFSTSGVATINAGSTSKTITPGVDINTGSFVLLTPKANLGGRALWFTTDGPNERFTIHISSPRGSSTKIAWLLCG